jgi:hypothetical protein
MDVDCVMDVDCDRDVCLQCLLVMIASQKGISAGDENKLMVVSRISKQCDDVGGGKELAVVTGNLSSSFSGTWS